MRHARVRGSGRSDSRVSYFLFISGFGVEREFEVCRDVGVQILWYPLGLPFHFLVLCIRASDIHGLRGSTQDRKFRLESI